MHKKSLIIGITGGSGSGKTTFLHQLKDKMGEQKICILSADNYYLPTEVQSCDDQGIVNYDLPTAINRDELVRDVKRLIEGQVVEREEYTFNNPNRTPEQLSFHPAPIIILEGIFVFHYEELASMIDLKVFLYTSESTSLSRRIRRDRLERNYPLEDVLYRYENHVLPIYRKYIEPIKEQADILINNNHNFQQGLLVMEGYLNHYLSVQESTLTSS